jgi:uncharacterized membrane protein YfcA
VAPALLLNLAAVQPEHHQLRFHYLATAAPLLAAGAVAGLAVVRSARRQWLAPLLVLLVLVAGYSSWRYGPAPWARDPVAIPTGPTDQARRQALALVADRELLDRLQADPAWRTLLDRQEVVVLERQGAGP